MGKIRLKVIGDEQAEEQEKKKIAKKREQKKMAKAPGLKGGEKVVSVEPSEEEIAAQTSTEEKPSFAKASKGKKEKFLKKKVLGKRYVENSALVSKERKYKLSNALETLKKFKKGSFDETVELHLNVKEKGISGQIALPHGTGKQLRVKIADDAILAEVEKGKIDFDVLVATPQMMPKLAKVARVLGPKGLMPNPKAGTVTDKPEEAVKKLSAGQVNFKTESVAAIIHLSVGKVSFEDKKLEDNIKTVVETIGTGKIDAITLKSTMSPAIRLDVVSLGK